jgi:CheY-like chemotaxis protein
LAHVLVVDDDKATRDMLRLLLEDAGHTVLEAIDGEGALAALRAANQGLVVLLDYRMPRMSGLDVLRVVARDAALARRHAYMLVTVSPRLCQEHLKALAGLLQVPLVAKPFKMDVLLEAIDQAAATLPPPPE